MKIETVADRIRQARQLTTLNQEQFGKAIGVSKSAVSQWELGKTELSPNSLFAIERRFGIRAEWIATGHGERMREKSAADDQEFLAAYHELPTEEKTAVRVLVFRRRPSPSRPPPDQERRTG